MIKQKSCCRRCYSMKRKYCFIQTNTSIQKNTFILKRKRILFFISYTRWSLSFVSLESEKRQGLACWKSKATWQELRLLITSLCRGGLYVIPSEKFLCNLQCRYGPDKSGKEVREPLGEKSSWLHHPQCRGKSVVVNCHLDMTN